MKNLVVGLALLILPAVATSTTVSTVTAVTTVTTVTTATSVTKTSVTTLGTPSEPCVFSKCMYKAAYHFSSCPAGYSANGETKDCGSPTCLLGMCAYASREFMCCAASDCSWWDVSCNWGALKGYFVHTDEKTLAAWRDLTPAEQDKLTTAEKFGTLTDLELSNLDVALISGLKSIWGMTAHQLGVVSAKVHSMSMEQLDDFLSNVNPYAMRDGMGFLCSGVAKWTEFQVSSISIKLQAADVWGAASSWKSDQIDSLSSMVPMLNTSLIEEFGNSALAGAKAIRNFSARQISGLSSKVGSMNPDDFESTVKGVDPEWTHAAMMEQCEIKCESDSDMEFMNDPTVINGAVAVADYAERVSAKSAAAALAYANAFCSGDPTNTTEASALLGTAAVACTGSAKKNSTMPSFDKWTKSQQNMLVNALTAADALGSLVNWNGTALNALCHQYGSFAPSRIAELTAAGLVTYVQGTPENMALVAAFGAFPWSTVASLAIGEAAKHVYPEQRASWATKLKEGLGITSKWTCTQMASLRDLAAGLDASDLSSLSASAIKGILPKAITAMDAGQVKGFTPEGFVAMTREARKRVNGARLSMLGQKQRIAAVCGVLDAASETACPAAVVDLTMDFPTGRTPTTEQLLAYFQKKVTSEQVEVLSVLGDSDRPLMSTPSCSIDTGGTCGTFACYNWRKATCTDSKCQCAAGECASDWGICVAAGAGSTRRLLEGSNEVTVRMRISSRSQQNAVTIDAQAAATSLTDERGGIVVRPAVLYSVTGPITTATGSATATTGSTTTSGSATGIATDELLGMTSTAAAQMGSSLLAIACIISLAKSVQ